jgi:hypothetical protein
MICLAARIPDSKAPKTRSHLSVHRRGFTGEEQSIFDGFGEHLGQIKAVDWKIAVGAERTRIARPIVRVGTLKLRRQLARGLTENPSENSKTSERNLCSE